MKLNKILKISSYIIGGFMTIYYLYIIGFEILPSLLNQYCSAFLVSSLLFVFAIFGYLYSYFDKDMGSFMLIIGSIGIIIRYYIASNNLLNSLLLGLPYLIAGVIMQISLKIEKKTKYY